MGRARTPARARWRNCGVRRSRCHTPDAGRLEPEQRPGWQGPALARCQPSWMDFQVTRAIPPRHRRPGPPRVGECKLVVALARITSTPLALGHFAVPTPGGGPRRYALQPRTHRCGRRSTRGYAAHQAPPEHQRHHLGAARGTVAEIAGVGSRHSTGRIAR